MNINYKVDDIYAELGKRVMEHLALDKACDQLQAQVALLEKKVEELTPVPEVIDGQ